MKVYGILMMLAILTGLYMGKDDLLAVLLYTGIAGAIELFLVFLVFLILAPAKMYQDIQAARTYADEDVMDNDEMTSISTAVQNEQTHQQYLWREIYRLNPSVFQKTTKDTKEQ